MQSFFKRDAYFGDFFFPQWFLYILLIMCVAGTSLAVMYYAQLRDLKSFVITRESNRVGHVVKLVNTNDESSTLLNNVEDSSTVDIVTNKDSIIYLEEVDKNTLKGLGKYVSYIYK